MSTDKAFHEWGRLVPEAAARLAGLPPEAGWEWRSVTLKEKERRLDGVLEPQAAGLPVVFVECQGYPDSLFLVRWLEGILSHVKHKGPRTKWLALAVYLKRGDAVQAALKLGGSQQTPMLSFEPRSLVLRSLKPEQLLAFDDDGLIPLLPLTDVGNSELETSTLEWSRRLRESGQFSQEKKDSLLGVLGAFLAHRAPTLSLEELEQWMGGIHMEDTLAGQMLLQRGREAGMKEGMKEGLKEGLKEGMKTGVRAGREDSMRDSLRLVLQTRLGGLPAWVESELRELHEPLRMMELLRQALDIRNEEEARALFKGSSPAT